MKKILFIDRDGTLVIEPPVDKQLDSLEKLEFFPLVFNGLSRIVQELDFELVMVTNQDGLGTSSFPEETFVPAHTKMLKAFENEGIVFADIHIDITFPEQNADTRKPGIGMLKKYFDKSYDLANSFVIGDRVTDVLLAKNLGAKAIYIHLPSEELNLSEYADIVAFSATDWMQIYRFLKLPARVASVERNTKETQISVQVNVDGDGKTSIYTGLAFFDHMLEQIGRHGGIDLTINVVGDLQVDEHHTIEDTAIVLGEALNKALGNKKGVERYGFCLPMDDCLAQVAIDFGGRNWLVWEADFKRERVGEMPTEMFYHFFKSFADGARCNLNIKAEGQNEHHKIEAIFKALAKAIKMAAKRDINSNSLPSTKGLI